MPGTIIGGKRAANKNLEKTEMMINGVLTPIEKGSFYKHIGRRGGQESTTGGYASEKIGKDGRTGRQRARVNGRIGGKISKRPKNNEL